MLKLDGITKSFNTDFSLEVDFTAESGDLTVLVGPSGCGKSTTLSIILGLLRPDEGKILLDGVDITNIETRKRNIGCVFQDYALFENMSVADNIAFPMKVKHIEKEEQASRITNLLTLTGLSGYEKRRIDSLSGGEKQRVALARALAQEPSVLLLDEPLSALDAKLRVSLRSEIRRIQEETETTMIYVTHDTEEAMSISDKIVLMNRGKIEQIGTGEELYRHPKSPFAALSVGEGNLLKLSGLREAGAEIPSSLDCADGVFFRPESVRLFPPGSIPSSGNGLVIRGAEIKSSVYLGRSRSYELSKGSLSFKAQSGPENLFSGRADAIVGEFVGF